MGRESKSATNEGVGLGSGTQELIHAKTWGSKTTQELSSRMPKDLNKPQTPSVLAGVDGFRCHLDCVMESPGTGQGKWCMNCHTCTRRPTLRCVLSIRWETRRQRQRTSSSLSQRRDKLLLLPLDTRAPILGSSLG